MRIIRDSDWKLVGYRKKDLITKKPVFLFQHRQYGDILVLNEAKYIMVGQNIVLFFNASQEEKISVSKRREAEIVSKFPGLLDVLHKSFNFDKWMTQIQTLAM